jgi:DNA-binding NarL/FixJ family response regulator
MSAPGRQVALVGRDDELGHTRRALIDGSVVVVGDAGIGKTALWRAVVEELRQAGADTFVATPTEAEQQFSYAVLGDLLEGSADETATLPVPQRRALERALFVAADDAPTDPHLLSVAVRTLLARRTESRKVTIAIDDLQWADQASLAALSFALRRTPDVRLVATARRNHRVSLPVEMAHVELTGLSPGAMHHLIVQHLGYSLARPALLRLHALSAGNPFFALELARGVGRDGELVLPESLRSLLADRFSVLPAATRRGLAKAALGGSWDGDLAAAIDAGVVERGRPSRFVHPLFAEAAVEQVSESTRRELHREIAAAAPTPEQRARHLALAATGPDAAVAEALDLAARESVRRGASLSGARLWQSAAELTPAGEDVRRAERLVEAGIALLLSGSPDEADELLAANVPRLPPGALRHRALIHRALMLARSDSRAVIPALEEVFGEVEDPAVRHEVVALISSFETTVGNSQRASTLVRDHVRWAEEHAPEMLPAALLLAAGRATLDDQPAWAFLDRARLLASRGSEAPHPAWGWALRAPALMREDRWDEARAAVEEAARDDPAKTVYQEASRLVSMAMVELAAGEAAAARDRGDDVLCIGEQIMVPSMICNGHVAVAEAATLLGDVAAARAHIAAATAAAASVHAQIHLDAARQALGLLELGLGDAAAAATAFGAVSDDSYRHYGTLAGGRIQLDAVEALTSVGDVERAAWVAATIPTEAWEHDVAVALLHAGAHELDAAIDTLGAARAPYAPFRAGRMLLLQGRWQRMLRHRATARDALTAARETFTSIGALLWIARVDDELGRLGGRRPGGATLTESECRVAELVATGLSNKQVAARLVVSQRTVEVHLTKIYAKLDLTGRTALVARWPVASGKDCGSP